MLLLPNLLGDWLISVVFKKEVFYHSVANAGEISPEQNLTIECSVSPKDIGFIHKGQKVKFQVDTFNYNQWGLLEGEVLILTKISQ